MRNLVSLLLAVAAVFTVFTTSLKASLPPFHQAVKELEALLHDPAINNHFSSGEWIDSVQHVGNGWRLSSNKRTILAKITYKQPHQPGPIQFDIEWVDIGIENAQ